MDRNASLAAIEDKEGYWDFIVIGGGATGLGVAVEAAARGYKTLLLEQHDFAKGTSSRSTKLIHGGVRYLQQGDISLVLEALRERGLLMRNAPHLVHNLSFIVPSYDWWNGPFYGMGLKLYDALAGKLGLGSSRLLSREETLEQIPTVEPEGLRGGVMYHDGQFDDARLAITLAMTLHDLGGTGVNYMRVVGLMKAKGFVCGVVARDMETGYEREIPSRVVVNATGPFTDYVRRLDDADSPPVVGSSQGVHIVLDKEFQPGKSAIMVPRTDDKRVLFAVPWLDRVIVGTTDTPVPGPELEPRALDSEIDFLLTHAQRYLTRDPQPEDVLSVFTGIRPLVRTDPSVSTASISREHSVLISESGLVTITGGKWTTYRKMGEDTVNEAAVLGGLQERPCVTRDMRLHGWLKHADTVEPWQEYGADSAQLSEIVKAEPELGAPLHPSLPYCRAEIVWATRSEMARTVEDALSRRTRCLLLDARVSMEIADDAAALMARELGRDRDWVSEQVAAYRELAKGYLLA